MGDTKIQWTGKTWNPIRARNKETGEVGWFCEHVSHGCDHCYADTMNQNTYFGNGLPYKASSLSQLELFLDEKILEAPLRWRKPQKIFPCSMTDLFGRFVKDEWIDRIAHVMWKAEYHTFQTLTKRADRQLDYMRSPNLPDLKPIPNWWLGVSCENQETADERIPVLLNTPAAKRWISAEPLLGEIDFDRPQPEGLVINWLRGHRGVDPPLPGLDWVVVGGESGKGARSLNLAWIKSIVEQCQRHEVPVFVKQLGYRPWWDGHSTKPPADHVYLEHGVIMHGKVGWQLDLMKDRKGGLIEEWPIDLQIREFPK